jgi:hypothetical protein
MILENASNIILAESLCNLLSFLLRKCNATVIIINAQAAVEVASIC